MSKWLSGLRRQLLLLVTALVMITGITGATGIWAVRTLLQAFQPIDDQAVPLLETAARFKSNYDESLRNLNLAFSYPDNPEKKKELLRQASDLLKLATQIHRDFSEIEMFPKVKAAWNKIEGEFKIVEKDMRNTISHLNKRHSNEELSKLKELFFEGESLKRRVYFNKNVASLLRFISEETANAQLQSKKSETFVIAIMWFTLAAGVLTGLTLGWVFMLKVLKLMARTHRELDGIAHNVSASSVQVKDTAESLSNDASKAASSLEETVASLEELTSLVQLNADRAREGNSLSGQNRDQIVNGSEMMGQLQSKMSEIKTEAEKIKSVISIIDDIAFQTNLLALNAAVEAARAGDQGRGFAVVAEAVRSLAQKSSHAVKEIETLIMNTTDKVESGYTIASQVNKAFTDLSQGVLKVSDLNMELSASTDEQRSSLRQISVEMNNVDSSVQNNAAASGRLATSSEQLNLTVDNLKISLDALSQWLGLQVSSRSERTAKQEFSSLPPHFLIPKMEGTSDLNQSLGTHPPIEDNASPFHTDRRKVNPNTSSRSIDPFWGEAIEKIDSNKAS